MRLETERLILRQWRNEDRADYAHFTADPETRRFYPSTLTREESDRLVERFARTIAADGHGFFALERKSDGALIGDVGYVPLRFALRGNPRAEIGWLLGRPYWGQGYATEAARACLAHAFEVSGLSEIVAFTTPANAPSRRVMERLGMVRDEAGDFDHPEVAPGHPLRRHVLYRLANPAFSPAS